MESQERNKKILTNKKKKKKEDPNGNSGTEKHNESESVSHSASQAPLSMGYPRQEYWSGLPLPSPGTFLTQGLNLGLLHCRQILNHLSHQGTPSLKTDTYTHPHKSLNRLNHRIETREKNQ